MMKTLILNLVLSFATITFASEPNQAIADCPKYRFAVEHLGNMGFLCSQVDLQSEVNQDEIQAELICANKGDTNLADFAKLTINGTLITEKQLEIESLNIHFFSYSE